ncbi:hypothetical protein TrRE_jg12237, partial [Triparma retinervis]
MFSGEIYVLLT